MKKILSLLFVLMLVSTICFAQQGNQTDKKYTTDFDGVDWNSWSEDSKLDYCVGFLAAGGSCVNYFYYLSTLDFDPLLIEEFKELSEFFYVEVTANKLKEALNNVYEKEENLEIPIWIAIWSLFDKFKFEFGKYLKDNKKENKFFKNLPPTDVIESDIPIKDILA